MPKGCNYNPIVIGPEPELPQHMKGLRVYLRLYNPRSSHQGLCHQRCNYNSPSPRRGNQEHVTKGVTITPPVHGMVIRSFITEGVTITPPAHDEV
ncbi:hypothetical protein J6590_024894 [Homalodisca vitripennis]|nr:hypothetical protein J6590_024894 [Homalodisca vitripennis]